jgi:hypothetical protein
VFPGKRRHRMGRKKHSKELKARIVLDFGSTSNHDDLASHFHEILETVEKPDIVARGNKGSLKAAKNFGKKKWLVAVYREISKSDGFVITAYFLSTKPKGETIWRRH